MASHLDERNLSIQVDEVIAALWMSPRTIERYVSKVLNSGDVKATGRGDPLCLPTIKRMLRQAIFVQVVEQFCCERNRVMRDKLLSSCFTRQKAVVLLGDARRLCETSRRDDVTLINN